MSKLPPPSMTSGAHPLWGHSLEFRQSRKLFSRGWKEHGNIFGIQLMEGPAAVLVGAKYHKLVYALTDKTLNCEKTYLPLTSHYSAIGPFAGASTHKKQLPILHAPFSEERLRRYLLIIYRIIRTWMEDLEPEGSLSLYDEVEKVMGRIASECLFGKKFSEQIPDEVLARFKTKYREFGLLDFQDTLLKNRQQVKETLLPIIQHRKSHPGQFDDFLGDLIAANFGKIQSLSDDEIVDWAMLMLEGALEPPSGQTSWTILQLLQNPGYLSLVQQEVDTIPDEKFLLDESYLSGLPHMEWAVRESYRMRPMGDLIRRLVEEDWQLGSYLIPKGWLVILAADISHFDPEVFPIPDTYEPFRHAKGKQKCPIPAQSLVLFSGGSRRCPGTKLAHFENLMFSSLFFRHFEASLDKQEISMDLRNPGGIHIHYKKREASRPNPSIH